MRSKMTLTPDFQNVKLFELFLQGENFSALIEFLKTHGGINATDEYGRTALIFCITNNKNPIERFPFANTFAKKLIDIGIDINKKDLSGMVALHSCIATENYEILDCLLKNDAINLYTMPPLLNYAFNKNVHNYSLVIKLLNLGLNPYDKNEKGVSFYDILQEYSTSEIYVGGNKVDVKPILEVIHKKG